MLRGGGAGSSSLVSSRCIPSTNRGSRPKRPIFRRVFVGFAGAASLVVAASTASWFSVAHAEAPASASASAPAVTNRYFRLNEVKEHGKDSDRIWVTKGTRVFDITDWIAAHPGGPVILHAAGGSIDRFWAIFTIHQKQDVYDILEEYFIGDVDPTDLVDGQVPADKVEDPFASDPVRDPRLLEHTSKPCNAESPASALASFLTPTELFYVRNHLWVPDADEKSHVLTVELPDGTEKEYTLSDLKARFRPFSMTATLQCAGNRRKHMSAMAGHTSGLQWDVGAISNSEWTGVRLRDVLEDAGFPINDWHAEGVKHVQFVGAEAYGASIPVSKALDPLGDVMLAYHMAGNPLAPDHGYPLRVMVPGHTAARSVKWLEKIILTDEESQSQWQQHDYKCFGPNQTAKEVDWSSAPAIQESPVQSAVTSIKHMSSVAAGQNQQTGHGVEGDLIKIEGYAFSGGGRSIVRVDVSADGGKSWHQAEILPDEAQGHKSWSWKRWEWVLPKHMAGKSFVVKAVDESYNTQPDSYDAQYNFRGNLTTAWHRVDYLSKSNG